MKTQLFDQEKTLLLVMILAYGIAILIICWYSYGFILQLFSYLLSQPHISRTRP